MHGGYDRPMGREEVRFRSGQDACAAWLFWPEGAAPSACVVLGTGLGCVRNQGLDRFGVAFAAAGFAALAFDYRYFGDSEGEPRGLLLACRQRQDWRAAIAFARSPDGAAASRIALWGYSLGAAHVQHLAAIEPAAEPAIDAAICVAPVVNGLRSLVHTGGAIHPLRLMAAGARDGTRALRGAEPYRIPVAGPPCTLAALNSPDSAPGYAAMTPAGSSWRNEFCARVALAPPYRLLSKARRIDCPALYCITEEDDVNPPALGRRMAAKVRGAELRLYPGGHYDPFLGETFERMAADQADFLERRLLGAAAGV
jgi:pimeloyl-ACP methyl ester carboxylesterase